MNNRKIDIFDTTLRDGAQQRGVNFSVDDKLKIYQLLNEFGVKYIEGGWPGAIPKDTDFFNKLSQLDNSKLVAFGSTSKPKTLPQNDSQIVALNESYAQTVCLVAKSDAEHISNAINTTLEENLNMVSNSIKYFTDNNKQVFIDAEHYFDGYKRNKDAAIDVVAHSFKSGASCVILCDTNGGCLPDEISEIVTQTINSLKQNHNIILDNSSDSDLPILGIHAHNDTGCAVANTIAAVKAGVAHIQGTVNEYGERTGNANLLTCIANLELKLGIKCVDDLTKSYHLAHSISEIANININMRQPYVGDIAFAHKAGLHASAIKVNPDLYQHIDPKSVGNDIMMVVSEMAGKSSIALKVQELGFNSHNDPLILDRLTSKIKEMENNGYAFDMADASFELVLRDIIGKKQKFFEVESWRTISERKGPRGTDALSEATVKLHANGRRIISTGEGNGPVNALDAALRSAIEDVYPHIKDFELTDYRVRLLDTAKGTDSVTRVLITCYDNKTNQFWTTIGVGSNIVESSWEALTDCYIYGLFKTS